MTTNYDDAQRRQAELQLSPNLQRVANAAGNLSPEMVDTEGAKEGFTVTMFDVVQCLDRNEIDCTTEEARAALFGLLALAMHSSVDNLEFEPVQVQ